MTVVLTPDLEKRLHEIAQRRSQSVTELVEQAIVTFLESIDDPATWVQATEQQLHRVWPPEDFASWSPPNAS